MNVFKAASGLAGALAIGFSSFLCSAVTIEPIAWNVIGLDSNNPAQADGPHVFPVGVRACTDSDTSADSFLAFEWLDPTITHIFLSDDPTATGNGATGPVVPAAD